MFHIAFIDIAELGKSWIFLDGRRFGRQTVSMSYQN